jgi:hypothetical protein
VTIETGVRGKDQGLQAHTVGYKALSSCGLINYQSPVMLSGRHLNRVLVQRYIGPISAV